jgi:hypothetical protein
MGLTEGLLGMLDGLAGGRLSAQQIALLRDQMQALAVEREKLKEENANLISQLAELNRELERARTPDEYVEYRGALFRRRPDGQTEVDVYCRFCKIPMVSWHDQTAFTCSSCHKSVGFGGDELTGILRKIGTR